MSTLLWTATIIGSPQTVDLSVTGLPPDATVSLPSGALTTDESETLTITTASSTPFGTYPITITAVGSVTHSATFTLTVGPPPGVLENGVAVTGIAGEAGSDQFWEFDVPEDTWTSQRVQFTRADGTGDAELFVRRNTIPTDDDYDCRSGLGWRLADCFWFGGGDRWYVRLHGATAYSGLTLQATYALAPPRVVQAASAGHRRHPRITAVLLDPGRRQHDETPGQDLARAGQPLSTLGPASHAVRVPVRGRPGIADSEVRDHQPIARDVAHRHLSAGGLQQAETAGQASPTMIPASP